MEQHKPEPGQNEPGPKRRRRRGRDEGSVFKRADGQWVGSLSLGLNAKGQRRRRTIYGSSKGEVQEKLRELQTAADKGRLPEAGKMTVGQFLDGWYTNTHKAAVQPTTALRNEMKIRLHLVPHLGQVRLAKLTAMHVEKLFADMQEAGDSSHERNRCGKLLRQALHHAVKKGLVPHNVALDVELPRIAKKEMQIFDQEQAGTFLEEARNDRLFALYAVALDSGARQGELFGLQWPDIDFETGSMQIRRSLEEIKGQHRLKEPKTVKARRRIELSRFGLDAIHEHRKAMLAEGRDVRAGTVFVDTVGGWLRKSNMTRYSFKPIIKRANAKMMKEGKEKALKGGMDPEKVKVAQLPDLRFHDLRHTSASLLLLADVNVKVVSERLGHSGIEMTLSTYSHVLPTMQAKAARAIDGLFGRVAK
jgi:integrase